MDIDRDGYLSEIKEELLRQWPENRTINIVCYGHSVPSGYFNTPVVSSFQSYPFLLHRLLKEKYPFAVVNVIVEAIGGEESDRGAARFFEDVLPHRPVAVTIDYALNDRRIDLPKAEKSWRTMIEACLQRDIKPLLLTPSFDANSFKSKDDTWNALLRNDAQVRRLAEEYDVALVDSFKVFDDYINNSGNIWDLLSHPKHPNEKGHMLIAREIFKWF